MRNTIKTQLPNFLIIGAQKSGSSWLSTNLRTHPEVFMPEEELHFFDKDYNYSKGVDWYRGHFKEIGQAKAIGEKTPDYLWANGVGVEGHLSEVHLNIHQHLPDARLILILRNPVKRAVSAVKHIIRSRRITPHFSIDDLLVGEEAREIMGHGVIEYGFYYKQIDAYLQLFDRDKILILIYEEVMDQKMEYLKKVSQFLDIHSEYSFPLKDQKINAHKISKIGYWFNYYFPRIYFRGIRKLESYFNFEEPFTPKRTTLEKLYEQYNEPNQQLFEFMGRRINSWSNPFETLND